MKLYKLRIQNFRKLKAVEIPFSDATFLIGANNAGKTTTLDAIERLLEIKSAFTKEDLSKYYDANTEGEIDEEGDIIVEGEFRDVSSAILNERGFKKERLFTYEEDGVPKYGFFYRVRWSAQDGKTHREMKMHKLTLKEEFEGCTTPQGYIDAGISEEHFAGMNLNAELAAKANKELRNKIPELWNVSDEEEWFENPGGIAPNVINKLPKFLRIEANTMSEELSNKAGSSMIKILSTLFDSLCDQSQNFQAAVQALTLLEEEMDPTDPDKEFGRLMQDLNTVVDSVFPRSKIDVKANLSSKEALKPIFEIAMESNVKTSVDLQGTGMVRSVVFALLKYRKQRETERDDDIIIGFEEPELYLHPNAANSMRDTIYNLATGKTQIVSTTHSPFMIDLSQRPKQVLDSYNTTDNEYARVFCFNHSEAFNAIQEDDRVRVKMIQKIDDYVARVFFAKKVIVVEGDTEDVVFKQTIKVMPDHVRKEINSNYQVIKATGKATIISFVKYLKAMGVDVFVVHDEDSGTPGAALMNQPILDALGGDVNKRYMMHDCVEDVLGYEAPNSDKPYRAYCYVKDWTNWEQVPNSWKDAMKVIFSDFREQLN